MTIPVNPIAGTMIFNPANTNVSTISIWQPPQTYFITNSIDLTVQVNSNTYETVKHSELIKYIEERKLIEQNEIVRSLWLRYQMAVKLVRE